MEISNESCETAESLSTFGGQTVVQCGREMVVARRDALGREHRPIQSEAELRPLVPLFEAGGSRIGAANVGGNIVPFASSVIGS